MFMSTEEFYCKLQDSEYGQKYLDLIKESKVDETKRVECHHIQSKALGGTNDPSNLVRLNTYEHILAHVYLSKAIPCKQTLLPLTWMARKNLKQLSEQERIALEDVKEWAELREKAKRASSALLRTPEAKRKAIQNSQKARAKKYGSCTAYLHTDKVREKALNTKAEKYGGDRAGQFHTAEVYQKVRETRIRKYGSVTGVLHTPEVRKKAQVNIKKTKLERYGTLCPGCHTPEAIRKREAAKKITRQYQRQMKETPEFQQWWQDHLGQYQQWTYCIRAFLADYRVKSCKEFLEIHGYIVTEVATGNSNYPGE